jgi:hypothetical protein
MHPRSSLRPTVEIVRRGLFLPDGEVRCTTCHGGRSRLRHLLALPPDTEMVDPVDRRSPRSFDSAVQAPQPRRRMTAAEAQRVLPPGTEVRSTPR